ncbi:hypothetical protein [Methylobacterium sp. SD21]|uniref:hypothetical protein n=1 Tax=Methylobacterium litchii TaxID=3138810 RepID=UPI00313BCD8D
MNLSAILAALEPWKGVIASVGGVLAGVLGIVGGVLKQTKVADTTAADTAPPFGPRPGVVRLHADDRDLIGDAREAANELTRAVRRLTGVIEDQGETCHRSRPRDPE